MPRTAPTAPPHWRTVRNAYRELGSIAATARRTGLSWDAVRKVLRDHKVPLREPGGSGDPRYRRLHAAWRAMVRRSTDPQHPSYAGYGARGVGVHRSWLDFRQFRDWSIANGWKRNRALVLTDVDRDHGPANCCWVTVSEARRLRSRFGRRVQRPITAFGVRVRPIHLVRAKQDGQSRVDEHCRPIDRARE